MDPNVKQVKVDNWGIYFLQRLKHFFNRTDYCDLTLQFQDNAQLKVHRLVLSACTEYFELLERTCEMYEDCLVMPDDLQADVVVPIVNFMYTGQLEFRLDSLERLYQTSQVMNMPVLTKLLDAHRSQIRSKPAAVNYGSAKRFNKSSDIFKTPAKPSAASISTTSTKRSFSKAFPSPSGSASAGELKNGPFMSSSSITLTPAVTPKKPKVGEPRPTRYDLPEELDGNIFDDSFSNISYASEPLMIHPETRKRYPSRKPASTVFAEATSSRRSGARSVADIMECKKVFKSKNIFEEDSSADLLDEQVEMFQPVHVKKEKTTVSENIFDQIMDVPTSSNYDRTEGQPKVTIETKNSKTANNIDHAKIISEVLKKYPHLMKSNKNIKLKILNTPTNSTPPNPKKKVSHTSGGDLRVKTEEPDYTYESDVMDSQEAARLISLGVENVKGPWICLICGTPGRALHFTSYYNFRRHLVEVHKEKPVCNVCEFCGLKSGKRNYMLHHLYTKHGVEPPPAYHFPKCNTCSYIALSEALLAKHKQSHIENRIFRCNVCPSTFNTSNQLLVHIQSTGHKYSAERKTNLQCIYCLKVFLRESNLYAHIKANHKLLATQDGIIDDSDDESRPEDVEQPTMVKFEPPTYDEYESNQPQQYQIRPDGNIELVPKKPRNISPMKQKILNAGFKQAAKPVKSKPEKKIANEEFRQVTISSNNHQDEPEDHDEIVMIDNNEYVVRDNQLILRKKAANNNRDQYILSDATPSETDPLASTSIDYTDPNDSMAEDDMQEEQAKIMMKNTGHLNQSLIVVSNEEEYKALMNANHSIIFDESEANKTLTVLSTPHGAALGPTNIDLHNTQGDEMMIIQEDYPINVSQGLPSDNNIMVVYSHQDKPYQIITSQGIQGQYVQNTTVMTQNYAAINASTPVVSDHQAVIIDAQHAGSWQNNIRTNEEDNQPGTTVQEMTIVEPAEIIAVGEDNDSMTDLPEVTLQEETLEDNTSQISANAESMPHQVAVEQEQIDSDTPMNVDETTDTQEPCTEESSEAPNHEQEHNLQDCTDENNGESVEGEGMVEQVVEESIGEQEQTVLAETSDNAGNVAHDATENDVPEQEQSHEKSAQVTLVSNGVVATEVSKPVETLASEWSDDEYDVNEENTNAQVEDGAQGDKNESGEAEVEESIENIQQEMEKQISEASESAVGAVSVEIEQSEHGQEQEGPTDEHMEVNVTVPPPQEKISSLLNDWEDNESQEENEQTETAENEGIEEQVSAPEVEIATNETEPVKDKLKSLVSDWDEEEEEEKS